MNKGFQIKFDDPRLPNNEHSVLTNHGDYCTTVYPDGSESSNWPPGGDHYLWVMESLGDFDRSYQDSLIYNFEHECFHSLVPMILFGRASYVIWNSAHNIPGRMVASLEEEKLVYYLQQAYHNRIPIIDPQWYSVIQEAHTKLGGIYE